MVDKDQLLLDETLLSTANGYIGVRGNFEEGYPADYKTIRGTYMNGVYSLVDIIYGENCYGFPQEGETIINVFDAQGITLTIDGENFSVFDGTVLKFDRRLDIKKGVSQRSIEWQSPKGHHLIIDIKRMTSFIYLQCFTIDYSVTSVNYEGEILITSTVKADINNYVDPNDPRVGTHHQQFLNLSETVIKDRIVTLKATVFRSNIEIGIDVSHSCAFEYTQANKTITGIRKLVVKKGETVKFVKYCRYYDNRRTELDMSLYKLMSYDIEELYKKQEDYLIKFWTYGKIDIEGEDAIEEALNYNTYQLLSSAGKEPFSNIAAKGLSGEGYEGHYFWDTEIYMLPLFTLTSPEIAKNLLYYRYRTLDQAQLRGKSLNHKAAKYPWRTISGVESSPYYPAGTAQYHINADIAYAMIQYYLFTDDEEAMRSFGFELLLETSKLWLETGHYYNNQFRIDAVTGPDEYSALVNNNYYTNAMAKYHMQWTVKIYETLIKQNHEDLIKALQEASDKMYLPYDDSLNIDLQDEHFLMKKPWDFEASKDKHPLLLHYHPLVIYRHQVLKQADTVLAHLLLDDRPIDVIENSYDFYEPLTTHDSSLSYCVYGMMASKLGRVEEAYDYFKKTVRLDLDNLHGNTKDGLHIANAGGAFMSIPYGFAGLRIKSDGLHFKPVKPVAWQSYTFRLNYKKNTVTVKVSDRLTITSEKEIKVTINNRVHYILGESSIEY